MKEKEAIRGKGKPQAVTSVPACSSNEREETLKGRGRRRLGHEAFAS